MTIVPINSKGKVALDEFIADFKAGKIIDAIIIATKGDDLIFIPVTNTPAAYLCFMCHEGAHALHHLEDEGEC